MCVRKFLNKDDMNLEIKDETKIWKKILKEKRDKEAKKETIGDYEGPELLEMSDINA